MTSFNITITPTGAAGGPISASIDYLLEAAPAATQASTGATATGTGLSVSINPAKNNSTIFGAVQASGTSAFTAFDSNTSFDFNPGAVATLAQGTFHSYAASTIAGTPVTVGSGVAGTDTGLAIAAAEIIANSTLFNMGDIQSSNANQGTSAPLVISVAPPTGALIVLRITANGSSGTATVTVTDDLGNTWHELVKSNPANAGYAGVWCVNAPGPSQRQQVRVSAGQTLPFSSLAFGQITLNHSLAVVSGSWFFAHNTDLSTGWTITDNAAGGSNTWVVHSANGNSPPSASQTNSSQWFGSFVAYCLDAKPFTAVTMNNSNTGGNSVFMHFILSEWVWPGSPGTFDVGLGASGTGNSNGDFSGTPTTTASSELIIAAVDAWVGLASSGQPSGQWQFSSDNTAFNTFGGQWTPGVLSPDTWTGSGGGATGQQYTQAIAAFRLPVAGGGAGLMQAVFP